MCLFGGNSCGNSCTWVLILVIVFLLSQNCGNDCDYENRGNGCGNYNGCNCGC